MFDYISGTLVQKWPTQAVIDVAGVGYVLKISLSTSQQLPEAGQPVKLKSYLHVREDIFQFYGFISDEERDIFLHLTSISGIGPRLAQTVLSGLTPERVAEAIQNGDERALSSISGIGGKTAQRLIVELKDKLRKYAAVAAQEHGRTAAPADSLGSEAIMALISLGYSRQQAEKAVSRARQNEQPLTAEELIKKSLQAI
jgi:Holliday junction DNA helicase RuvA